MEKNFIVKSRVGTDTTYSHDGNSVTLKSGVGGGDTIVSENELAHLHTNQVFLLHKKNGFIDVAESVAPEEEPEMLVGSSTQPATFELEDGTTLSLGDVVGQAFTASGLTVEKWNKQADKKREKAIADIVAGLPLKKVEE